MVHNIFFTLLLTLPTLCFAPSYDTLIPYLQSDILNDGTNRTTGGICTEDQLPTTCKTRLADLCSPNKLKELEEAITDVEGENNPKMKSTFNVIKKGLQKTIESSDYPVEQKKRMLALLGKIDLANAQSSPNIQFNSATGCSSGEINAHYNALTKKITLCEGLLHKTNPLTRYSVLLQTVSKSLTFPQLDLTDYYDNSLSLKLRAVLSETESCDSIKKNVSICSGHLSIPSSDEINKIINKKLITQLDGIKNHCSTMQGNPDQYFQDKDIKWDQSNQFFSIPHMYSRLFHCSLKDSRSDKNDQSAYSEKEMGDASIQAEKLTSNCVFYFYKQRAKILDQSDPLLFEEKGSTVNYDKAIELSAKVINYHFDELKDKNEREPYFLERIMQSFCYSSQNENTSNLQKRFFFYLKSVMKDKVYSVLGCVP